MKVIMCQPENLRFEWELRISINNLIDNGITDIILLFLKQDESVSINLKKDFPNIKIFKYEDNREYTKYIPNIKPYLWYRFLEENPKFENEDFLYIDSDVIFREMINYKQFMFDDKWYGSNCNGYLNASYIKQTKNGNNTLKKMCDIVGISVEQFENMNDDCIGAQLIVKKPKADYWKKVYNDSNKIWDYFETLDSNIQKWTAEMWSQLLNMPLFSIKSSVNSEFDFTWATDYAEKWFENKIFHNAGVVNDENGLFFKGKYVKKTPFFDDFSSISKEKASYFYVKEIEKVKNKLKIY